MTPRIITILIPIIILAIVATMLLITEPSGKEPIIAAYYLTMVDPDKIQWHYWKVLVLEPDDSGGGVVEVGLNWSSLLLAYLNVGYAEEWRSYWSNISGAPWVHGPTEYDGEYYIEYWRPEWHEIMKQMTTQYLDMGFEGIYLDNIDAAEIIGETSPSWASGVDTQREMISLVCNISNHVKSLNPGYKVYINIGGVYDMLYNQTLLDCIDGVLREELWTAWTGANETIPQDPDETRGALAALEYAHNAGKEILVADPARTGEEAEDLCSRAWSRGFIPVPQPAWAMDYEIPPLASWCTSVPEVSVDLTASNTVVEPGGVVTLYWSITGATGWISNIPGAGIPGVDYLVLSPLVNASRVSPGVGSTLGYVSLTTVGGWEPWAGSVSGDMIIGYTSWGDAVVNASDPRWHQIILWEAIPYVLSQGFDGVMLDNLDMVDAYPELTEGVISLIQELREAYPGLVIMVNRGFTILEDVAPHIDALLFEAYGSYYDFSTGQYKPYTGEDLKWIKGTLRSTMEYSRAYGFKVLGLAYGDPEQETWSSILETVCSLNSGYMNPVYIARIDLMDIGLMNPCRAQGSFLVYYGTLEAVMKPSGRAVVNVARDTTFYIHAWGPGGEVNKSITILAGGVPSGGVEIGIAAYWGKGSLHKYTISLGEEEGWSLKVKVRDGTILSATGTTLAGEEDGYYILEAQPWNRGPNARGIIIVAGDRPVITEALLVVNGTIVDRWVKEPPNLSVEVTIDRDWGTGYKARLTVSNSGPGPATWWQVTLNTSSRITHVVGGAAEDLGGGLVSVTPTGRTGYIPPGSSVEVTIIAEKRGPNPYPEIVEYSGE
ncbi:MAG: endo alpha-1,4 polygalactosaminidase [Desulfurococcales archaeon]|nr:endo alpha-1,4 polygalactosaminidase [Desulfurococcales archaeon]